MIFKFEFEISYSFDLGHSNQRQQNNEAMVVNNFLDVPSYPNLVLHTLYIIK